MRHLLPALALLAFATAFTTPAHASTLDDFVLTGNGHTYAFSLPSTGLVAGEPGVGITSRVYFDQNAASATVDGVGGYSAGASFLFYPGSFGSVEISIAAQGTYADLLDATLFGPALVGYDPTSLSGYIAGPYTAFHNYGTFNLGTISNPGHPGVYAYTPYTLTISPEASTAVTPEPATLTLLGTGALGLLSTLRRRVLA